MTALDLVGQREIALRAGVLLPTVHRWRERSLGFPPPLKNLAAGPVWLWGDVERWLRETGRLT